MSEEVRVMFSEVAENYDKMNDLFTFNMHNKWKKKLVKMVGAKKGDRVLDCASGTGDLAFEFKKVVGNSGEVLATDFCDDMLKYVEPKGKKLNLEVKTEFADAMNLHYEDNTFDIVSISYGIRNVDDTPTALKEMARVLKPGGKIAILETGQPPKILLPFYWIVTNGLLPLLSRMLTGSTSAYKYLADTASSYPYGKKFVKIMEETGAFEKCTSKAQFLGASFIYLGTVKK